MRTSRLFLLSLALHAAGGCAMRDAPSEERARRAAGDGEIVVAAVWPWQARGELRYGQGLDLALEEINAAGGVDGRPIRLIREDDHESVNEGRLVAQRLAENPDVMAVIGHLQSYVTVPAAAIYDLAGLVLVSPASTSMELTSKGYPRVFRTTLTDRAIGRQMADFALDRGYARVGIYYVRNEYGRALANAFEERTHGRAITVAVRHSYDQELTERSMAPVLREWRHMDLDAIFLAGEVPLAGRVIAAIREAGIDAAIIGPDAMSSPALIVEGGAAVEGTVVASVFHPDEPRPAVRDFVRRFRARYGVDPDPASAVAYDALRLLARAMQSAGTPAPAAVAEALHSLEWRGVTGDFAFDTRGELSDRRAIQLVVRDGSFAFLPDARLADAAPAKAVGP